jgi:hypothetical protein
VCVCVCVCGFHTHSLSSLCSLGPPHVLSLRHTQSCIIRATHPRAPLSVIGIDLVCATELHYPTSQHRLSSLSAAQHTLTRTEAHTRLRHLNKVQASVMRSSQRKDERHIATANETDEERTHERTHERTQVRKHERKQGGEQEGEQESTPEERTHQREQQQGEGVVHNRLLMLAVHAEHVALNVALQKPTHAISALRTCVALDRIRCAGLLSPWLSDAVADGSCSSLLPLLSHLHATTDDAHTSNCDPSEASNFSLLVRCLLEAGDYDAVLSVLSAPSAQSTCASSPAQWFDLQWVGSVRSGVRCSIPRWLLNAVTVDGLVEGALRCWGIRVCGREAYVKGREGVRTWLWCSWP